MQKMPYLVPEREPGQTNQRNPQSHRQLLRRMIREHVLLGGAAWVVSGGRAGRGQRLRRQGPRRAESQMWGRGGVTDRSLLNPLFLQK